MVELRGVSKSYGSTVALHPTDFTFPEGQTTALIGPSGCGKSTLLRLIIRLIEPTSGQVIFDGQPVTDSNALNVRRETGYVIQDGGLFPHLTAEQNVTLVANIVLRSQAAEFLTRYAESKNEAIKQTISASIGLPSHPVQAMPRDRDIRNLGQALQERVKDLADLVRIPAELLQRYPAQLSGGQKQRVALMRALMLEPKVLLLDEPLAALDPLVRAALQTDLKRIFEQLQTTVILVTHDMAEAAYLGQTIVLLREGKIVQKGSLQDFQQRPAEPFVTEFLNAQRSLVAL